MDHNEIKKFVEDAYARYGMSFESEFYEYVDDEEILELPWDIDGKLNMALVEKAAEQLGTSVDAILRMDEEYIDRWFYRFHYIYGRKEIGYMQARAFYGLEKGKADKCTLLAAIFDVDLREFPSLRFGRNLSQRVREELEKIEESVPGTVHKDAKITDLRYQVQHLCSYEGIKETVHSYIEMIDIANKLFQKALYEELEEEEIHEYNIIISTTRLYDRMYISCPMYYRYVRKNRKIYIEEGFDHLLSYAKQSSLSQFEPWVCAEFWEDRKLVQEYVNIWPEAKKHMREFGMMVSKIYCTFIWSDAEPIVFEDEFVDELNESDPILERTNLYIPKTKEELGEDEQYLERINELTKSEKLGGISAHQREVVNGMEAMIRRVENMSGRC